MNCEKCGKLHDGTFASGRFCCKKCARSFNPDDRLKKRNEKISASLKGRRRSQNPLPEHFCEFCNKGYVRKCSLRSHLAGCILNPSYAEREKKQISKKEKLLTLPFDEMPNSLKYERLFREQNGCCNRCGLNEWQGQKIPLEIEHKNGNHHDNERLNIELLCPNCHALTDTWRGRNKNKGKSGKRVSDEELIHAINSNQTIRQALLSVGLAAKGGNYERAKRLRDLCSNKVSMQLSK